MARTTWLAERGGSVSVDLAVGHDVGLAEETGLHASELTVLRVNELLATAEARSTVEARYLDGHSAFFPDIAGAFEKQLRAS